MSMTRNQSLDDEASSSGMRSKSYAPWSDLDHNLLFLVMMKLRFGDYYSLRGVCKSWRLLADSNKNRFMESRPPMSITISSDANENVCCYLEDFEGRKFKTILPDFAGGDCFGVTCGHLIFFNERTRDFWLVNPITRHQLHFPHSPFDYDLGRVSGRAILIFSPSISRWVFVMLHRGKIWYSVVGKGAWNHVSYTFHIYNLYAFKGKIYTLSRNLLKYERCRLCELRLNPEPIFTLLQTKNPLSSKFLYPNVSVSSGENLYMTGWVQVNRNSLVELDLDEMKWVKPCEKTIEEYAFFRSDLNSVVVAVRRELWADPRSRSLVIYALSPHTYNNGKFRLFTAKMWYFPHECMDVDPIDE